MTTKIASPITLGAPATAAVLNAPMGQLDSALADLLGLAGDLVLSGGLPGTSASLSVAQPAARAMVNNFYVLPTAQALLMTASSDNYVDLDSAGAYHITPVANGAAMPVVFANSIRMFKAVAGVAAVTAIVDFRTFPMRNHVKTFGIKADGVTDDTTAWVAMIAAVPAGSLIDFAPVQGPQVSIVSNFSILKPLTIEGGGWGQTGQTRRFGQASELIAATSTVYSSSRLKAKPGSTGYMISVGQHDPGGTANPYLAYDGALEGVFLRDFVMDGNGRSCDIGALKYNTVEHGRTENLRIEHFCREAIKCEESVREYQFNGIWAFFCGNTTDGQGPAPGYYPCINLFDNSAGADLHNLLSFNNLRLIFPMGDAILIDTQATVSGSQVRDISVSQSYIHGPVSGVSGFPYVFSALQQQLTPYQIKSCTDVRIIDNNVICCGTADGTGAVNFIRQRTGTSGVAPSIICVTGSTFQGRYAFTGTPRYGLWIQNGDIRLETSHVDGGDTFNVRTEVGGVIYYGLLNVTPNGSSIGGNTAIQNIPMQITWAGQQEIAYPGSNVAFKMTSLDTPRTIALNMGSAANGNIPGGAGGWYGYDLTAPGRRFYMTPAGHFHHDMGISSGVITPTEAVLVSGVDVSQGNAIEVTLSAARVVGAPLNPTIGQEVTFVFIQNGTGGWAITWNAAFKTAWAVQLAANGISSITFKYDGTSWQQVGGQVPVDALGNASIQGSLTNAKDRRVSRQSPAFAASFTPDPTLGEIISIGALTATITINAVASPVLGQVMTFIFLQDGTGGRAIAWNAAYKTAWQPAAGIGAVSSITFEFDGTSWQQAGGQIPVDALGNAAVQGSLVAAKDVRRSRQTPSEAVLVSGVDATAGEVVAVTLTASRVVGLPLNPASGQFLTFIFTQNGTGGWFITWNAGFKTGWMAQVTANAISAITFMYDGTSWQQVAGQLAVDHLGNAGFPAHLIAQALGATTTNNLGANVTSATPVGNDTRGEVTIVMSGALAANTRICRVNYATTWLGSGPGVILLVNQTSGAALVIVNFYSSGETTGGFDLLANQALAAGTYKVRYVAVG